MTGHRDRRGSRNQALAAEALLLGLRTYEQFAGIFPSRPGELPDRFNSCPQTRGDDVAYLTYEPVRRA